MTAKNHITSNDYGIFILRFALGIMFIAHAGLKYFVFTMDGTVGFFTSLGLPGFAAYLVTAAEFFGGLALLLGIYTRQVALLFIPLLAGTVWAHAQNGWVFSNQGGGWEYPLFLTISSFVLFLLGDGPYALKTWKRA